MEKIETPEHRQALCTVLQKVNGLYEEKLKAGSIPEQAMFTLSCDIEQLKALNSEGHSFAEQNQLVSDRSKLSGKIALLLMWSGVNIHTAVVSVANPGKCPE